MLLVVACKAGFHQQVAEVTPADFDCLLQFFEVASTNPQRCKSFPLGAQEVKQSFRLRALVPGEN